MDVSSPLPHPLPRLTLGHTHPFPAWFWDVTRRDVTSRLVLGCIVTHLTLDVPLPYFYFYGSSFFFFIFALADRSLSFTCTWGPPPARLFVTCHPDSPLLHRFRHVALLRDSRRLHHPCRVAVVLPQAVRLLGVACSWCDTRFGPVADM